MRALAQATLVFTVAYLGATSDEPKACQDIIDSIGETTFLWEMARLGADPKVATCFDTGGSLPGLLGLPGLPGLPGAAGELDFKPHTDNPAGNTPIADIMGDTNCSAVVEAGEVCHHPCCIGIVKFFYKSRIRRCVSDEDYPTANEYLLCKASQDLCDAEGNIRNPVKIGGTPGIPGIPGQPGIPGIPGVPGVPGDLQLEGRYFGSNAWVEGLMEKESEQKKKDRAAFFIRGAVPVHIAGLTAFISAALGTALGAAGMYVVLRCQKVGQDAYSKLEDQIQ